MATTGLIRVHNIITSTKEACNTSYMLGDDIQKWCNQKHYETGDHCIGKFCLIVGGRSDLTTEGGGTRE